MSDYEVRSWDTQSKDYSASVFHEINGTGCSNGLEAKQAGRLFNFLCRCPSIERVSTTGPEGTLSWERHEPTPPECVGSDMDADNY